MKATFILLVTVLVCSACLPKAEIPPAPVLTTPLVEYSVDGETWYGLTKGEVKNLPTSVVWIRKTEQGAFLKILVIGDTAAPLFFGSVTEDKGVVTAEGRGALIIRADSGTYAKVVLVPPE